MKLITTTLVAASIATSGMALDIGGHASLYYGAGTVSGDTDGYTGDEFTLWGFNGSVGGSVSGNFALQLDANYETGSVSSPEDYYVANGFTLHASYDLGSTVVGIFAGTGVGDHFGDGDEADVYWYGIEAARDFGAFTIAGQIGTATSDNSHSSISYDNKLFAAVETRYFINDNFMVRGGLGYGTMIVHDRDASHIQLDLDTTFGLGFQNLYGFAGYRYVAIDDNSDSSSENRLMLGVTLVFGGNGGTLRDAYAYTPMVSGNLSSMVAVSSSAID